MLTEADVRELIESSNIEVDARSLPADGDLAAHGMDSLDVFTLLVAIQEKTGREVPDSDLDELKSIEQIVRYFERG